MFFAFLLLMGIGVEPVSANEWHTETVDSEGYVGGQNSLALDPTTGYPRISYRDSINADLKYAAYDGSTWHTETVDSAGDVRICNSLALDPTTGYPRISYYDDTNKDLKYAAYDGSTWQIETIDSEGIVEGSASLALDPTTGYPRISYYVHDYSYGAKKSDLKYAAYNGSTWHTKTVYSRKGSGYGTSLALDPTTGYPRISCLDYYEYQDTINDNLKYLAYDGSKWHTESLAGGSSDTSLALDPTTGYPRISYYDAGSWSLKYAAYDGSTWHIETVDSARIVGWSISLALDPTTGYPRISYYDSKSKDLKYASYDGSTWHTLTVDSVGEAGSDNSLALDPTTGYPRISYYDATNDDLKYAFLLPDNQSPSITGITVPVDPVFVNTEVSISGTFTDQDTADTHTAVWDWGDSATSDGTVTEGDGTINGLHTYTTPGIYPVTLTVTDLSGAAETETAETYIVIYDPTGGFVTGGGWFDSPSGAYRGNPTLTGKAEFEFVSKYQKGATVPEGNIQFKFKTADLKFDITSYKWLVVNKAGMNAQFSGQGTINGGLDPNNEEYKFMIWATDGNPDTFWIKIWWEDNSVENIVYDNDMEQPIGGGAIQVHAK